MFIFGAALSLSAAQAAAEPSVADWRESIARLVADVRATHPDPFTKVGRLTFARAAQKLQQDLPQLTEEQRVIRTMRLLALFGDGHTQVEPTGPDWRLWYPVRIMEFPDGYFVTAAHRSVQHLAGAQILEMGGTPIDAVAEDARTLMGADNQFDRRQRMYAVHNSRLMKGLGYANADGSIEVKARLRSGKVVERKLTPQALDEPRFVNADTFLEWVYPSEVYGIGKDENWVAAFGSLPSASFRKADATRPIHLAERTRYFTRSIAERDAYYIQLNQIDDTTFMPFVEQALQEVDAQRPRHLIIDMRNNFGGDASRALEAVHSFVRREQSRPWQQLYVLTGPKTFSAATLFLAEFLDNVQATIVGEPGAAALNHYGDPTAQTYLKAGLRAQISTLWHQKSDSNDLRTFLPVDVPAPFTFTDYINGHDPAVDAILAGKDMRSIPQIVRADGGARAREVYLERTKQFGNLDWYTPPTEIELRRACDHLVDSRRIPEALEACTLTTEIHPFVWNSWYNLGQTQRAAGMMQERLSSYRCVLALEPDNFNGPGLRKAIGESKILVPLPAGCPIKE
jgi:hypothetical protein